MKPPEIPALLTELANRCRAAGGRALLVGGGVRDWLLGMQPVDWDVEVFGLAEDRLREVLDSLGRVDAVGRSFGVYKLHRGPLELDVSLPRRDSKVGAGHRGIAVQGDPTMTPAEAARRRDLTINALMLDPLTGDVIDPWGGRDDVAAGRLRAVDPDTFLEDPLRALRVVQFAARFGFDVVPELEALCRSAALDELPAERVQGEWLKLLLKGRRPSAGLGVARRTAILTRVFPEAAAVDRPEVDAALDRLAAGARDAASPEGRRLALMLAAWLHGGDAATVEATLDRLWLHRWKGYALRDRTVAAVANGGATPDDDAALRRLATQAEPELVLLVAWATTGDDAALRRLERARDLGVAHEPPEPLLRGRHLKALGVPPGPAMGRLLEHVYALQLDGAVTDFDGAREAGARWWAENGAG